MATRTDPADTPDRHLQDAPRSAVPRATTWHWVAAALVAVACAAVGGSVARRAVVTGQVHGWAWLAVLLVPVPGVLLGAAALRRVARRWVVATVVTVAALLMGLVTTVAVALPELGTMRVAARQVGRPDGWERVSTAESGDAWCIGDCSRMFFAHAASGPPGGVVADMAARLRARGFDGGPTGDADRSGTEERAPLVEERYVKGRISVTVEVPSPSCVPGCVPMPLPFEMDLSRYAGRTPVWLTYALDEDTS